jgi:hypothetical protein
MERKMSGNGIGFIEERRDHAEIMRALGEIVGKAVGKDDAKIETMQMLISQVSELVRTLIAVEAQTRVQALEVVREGRERRWKAGRFARILTLGIRGWKQAALAADGGAQDLDRLMASVQAANRLHLIAAMQAWQPLLEALGVSSAQGCQRLMSAVYAVLPEDARQLLEQALE